MRIPSALRRRIGRWIKRHRPVILLYHRVAEIQHDPWSLAIRPGLFAEQVEALARKRKVVPLDRLVEALEQGRAPSGWAAITFDDGYADLLHEALPVLRRFGCPATLFLTTDALDSEGFWWDRLSEAIFRPPELSGWLTLDGSDEGFRWDAHSQGVDRNTLHLSLWKWLRKLDPERRDLELMRIESWAGVRAPADGRFRTLTTAELLGLVDGGIFSIGAHGLGHAPLPELTRFEKAAEIAGSRRRCEEILGRPVEGFAYPFGEMDAECREEVRRAGFRFACSTVPAPVDITSPRFALPRIPVEAWRGDELLQRLP